MSALRAGRPLGRKRMWFPQLSTAACFLMFWLPGIHSCSLKTQSLLLEKYFYTCVALVHLSVKVFCEL